MKEEYPKHWPKWVVAFLERQTEKHSVEEIQHGANQRTTTNPITGKPTKYIPRNRHYYHIESPWLRLIYIVLSLAFIIGVIYFGCFWLPKHNKEKNLGRTVPKERIEQQQKQITEEPQ